MNRECGLDYSLVFDQYLRTTKIPVLKWRVEGGAVWASWDNVVAGFEVPVVVSINGTKRRVTIGQEPQRLAFDGKFESFELDRNFYMKTKRSTQAR